MRYQRAEFPLKLGDAITARDFFASCLAEGDPAHETLWVAHLDADDRFLHLSQHSGDASGIDFPLRDIIVDAATHGSSAILLAHNHPSGDPNPSESDLSATRRLAAAVRALECTVLDHLVFAGAECTSMRQLGYV